jgi:hypothetical protein
VIVNDAGGDQDGDGLGPQLEAALCTCDMLTPTPPSGAGCPSLPCLPPYTRNAQDSDGDGIRDDYETLGINGSDTYDFPQQLPMWGANPAHKDIFVEMDYVLGVGNLPAAQALAAAQAYNRSGTAAHLKNRDNLNGVALHVDIGLTDATCGTTCGDWGGVGEVDANYPNPDYAHFAKVRRGIFHYGKAAPYPGVSAFGWAFSAGPQAIKVAHELGHNLDLYHGGARSSIDTNAKPNYQSLMNYMVSELVFSVGEKPILTPTNLCEENGLQITDPSKMGYLSAWGYTVSTTPNALGYYGVDWNRDGVISPCTAPKRPEVNSRRRARARTILLASCDEQLCGWWQSKHRQDLGQHLSCGSAHGAALRDIGFHQRM